MIRFQVISLPALLVYQRCSHDKHDESMVTVGGHKSKMVLMDTYGKK